MYLGRRGWHAGGHCRQDDLYLRFQRIRDRHWRSRPITIAGLITASMVYQMAAVAAGNTAGQTFAPCIPASAANTAITAITITTTADASATAVDVNSWGYQQ